MKSCRSKHFVEVIFLFFLSLILSGCWDAREVANLAIVSGVGIDLDERTGQVLLTIQVIKPAEVKSGGGGGGGVAGGEGQTQQQRGGQKAFLIASSSGRTVAEAFRNFTSQLNREIYLSENQIIVFGNTAAKKGVRPLLDYFIRTRQTRENAWILVSNEQAAEIITTGTGLEKIPSIEITKLIENRNMASQASGVSQQEFVNHLMSKTWSPYASFIQVEDGSMSRPVLVGTAIFKGDKLIGRLDKTETRGLLWITGKVKRGIITVNTRDRKVDFGILKAGSKVDAVFKEGMLAINVSISSRCGLISESWPQNFNKTKAIAELENILKQAIRKEILTALIKARQFDADLFGFGEVVHKHYPQRWRELEPEWDRIFKSLPVTLKLKVTLEEFGLSRKGPLPE